MCPRQKLVCLLILLLFKVTARCLLSASACLGERAHHVPRTLSRYANGDGQSIAGPLLIRIILKRGSCSECVYIKCSQTNCRACDISCVYFEASVDPKLNVWNKSNVKNYDSALVSRRVTCLGHNTGKKKAEKKSTSWAGIYQLYDGSTVHAPCGLMFIGLLSSSSLSVAKTSDIAPTKQVCVSFCLFLREMQRSCSSVAAGLLSPPVKKNKPISYVPLENALGFSKTFQKRVEGPEAI